MKNLFIILLAFILITSCRKETEEENKTIGRQIVNASEFFPLSLGNTWEYKVLDSNYLRVDSTMELERIDSCCYYINVFNEAREHLGWKWRDYQHSYMYANSGNAFFSTDYIERNRGHWYRLDSTRAAQNIVITDLASGLHNVQTELGNFQCIKTRTRLSSQDGRHNHVYTRYFGRAIGLVKMHKRSWMNYGTRNAYVKETETRVLAKANLN